MLDLFYMYLMVKVNAWFVLYVFDEMKMWFMGHVNGQNIRDKEYPLLMTYYKSLNPFFVADDIFADTSASGKPKEKKVKKTKEDSASNKSASVIDDPLS